jgi:8-oxo-dGTP diphosphatase
MNQYYSIHPKFYLALDCIIFGFDDDKLKLLLIERDFEPGKGQLSLMGGFLNDDESVDEAAARILKNLTGLSNVYLEQLYAYGEVQRDLAARVISLAYYALIKTDIYDESKPTSNKAYWVNIEDIPQLVFDHNIMVDKALKRLRRKAKSQPIGFELLPQRFTLPQLQKLYEAIYQEKFDKRNFRKKILSFGVLKQLNEKEKESSKRGAFYYTFDKNKYDNLVSEGIHFEL